MQCPVFMTLYTKSGSEETKRNICNISFIDDNEIINGFVAVYIEECSVIKKYYLAPSQYEWLKNEGYVSPEITP